MSNDYDFGLPAPKPIVGSPEQSHIWNRITHSPNHLMVDALAGTGKTFTCENGQRRLRTSNAMVCFGVATEEEYKARNPGLTCMTFHKLGNRLLGESLKCKPRIDRDKADGILNGMGEDYGFRKYWPRGLRWAVSSLADKLKQGGFILTGNNGITPTPEQVSVMEATMLHHDIFPNYDRAEFRVIVMDFLVRSMMDTTTIDFADMLWLPIQLDLHGTPYENLFIDESQDLNPVQQELAFRMGKRLIFVGDTNQAIFGFRGADSRSLSTIRTRLERSPLGVETLPLTVCRRCPVDVIRLAQEIVPDIKPLDNAEKGEVVIDPNPFANLKPADTMICRVNAPLVRALYGFWKEGTDAYMLGRDVADGLKSLLMRLDAHSIPDLHNKLDCFQSDEEGRIMQRTRGVESQLAMFRDKCDCLRVLTGDTTKVEEVELRIKRIQNAQKTPNSIRLSSIHRIKGSEADRVHILHPEFLPHAMASQDWEKEQEANLAYVAVTRSRNYLSFAGSLPSYFTGAASVVRSLNPAFSFQELPHDPEQDLPNQWEEETLDFDLHGDQEESKGLPRLPTSKGKRKAAPKKRKRKA